MASPQLDSIHRYSFQHGRRVLGKESVPACVTKFVNFLMCQDCCADRDPALALEANPASSARDAGPQVCAACAMPQIHPRYSSFSHQPRLLVSKEAIVAHLRSDASHKEMRPSEW